MDLSEAPKFLGRTLDVKTMTYSFGDGSRPLPAEMKYDVEAAVDQRVQLATGMWSGNGPFVLGTLFSWKHRLGID